MKTIFRITFVIMCFVSINAFANVHQIENLSFNSAQSTSTLQSSETVEIPSYLMSAVSQAIESSSFTYSFLRYTSSGGYIFDYTTSNNHSGYIILSDLTQSANIVIEDDLDGV